MVVAQKLNAYTHKLGTKLLTCEVGEDNVTVTEKKIKMEGVTEEWRNKLLPKMVG